MNKHKLLEDILDDLNQDPHFFEDMLEQSGMSSRNVMQMYLVYKFKWLWSEEAGKDIGYSGALQRWVDGGLAEYFAERYDENASLRSMYQRVLHYENDLKAFHKGLDEYKNNTRTIGGPDLQKPKK